jgi:hypothetical protein
MFSSDGWIERTSGDETIAKAAKCVRVHVKSWGVAGGQPEVEVGQPKRPT